MSRYQGMNLEAAISEVCASTDITTHAVQLCRTYSIITRARVAADSSSLLCSELPPSSDQDCRRVRPPAASRRVPVPKNSKQQTIGSVSYDSGNGARGDQGLRICIFAEHVRTVTLRPSIVRGSSGSLGVRTFRSRRPSSSRGDSGSGVRSSIL